MWLLVKNKYKKINKTKKFYMAEMTKMFVKYNGTRSQFESVKANYAYSVVFITGSADELPSIYARGNYYATDDFARALETKVNELNYVKGVKVGDKTYNFPTVEDGGGYLPMAAANPGTVDLSVQNGTVTIGVVGLGTKDSSAAADSSLAWGRIKNIEAQLSALIGSESGSIQDMIDATIADFYDASVKATVDDTATLKTWRAGLTATTKDASSNRIKVGVTTTDGEVTAVTVDASAFVTADEVDEQIADFYDASVKATVTDTATLKSWRAGLTATTKDASSNRIKVGVTTTDGEVTAVTVDASAFVTDGEVTDQISDALAALKATKDASSNSIKVTVGTEGGVVTSVAVDASAFLKESEFIDTDRKILADKLPSYLLGQVLYGGQIDATGKVSPSANFVAKYGSATTLPDASVCEGAYFIATANGTAQGVTYETGDWVISTGSKWEKIDNTDAITSVVGITSKNIDGSSLAARLADSSYAGDNELLLKSEFDEFVTDWNDSSIETSKLADKAVTTAKIADANVTTAKIADANVTTAKIADANVTTAKIADDAVTEDKLATDAVYTDAIQDSAVTTAKIADANVTTAKIADKAVTTAKIADANVTTAKIADANVTEDKLDASVKAKLNAEHVDRIDSSTDYLTFDKETGDVTANLDVAKHSATTSLLDDKGLVDNAGLKAWFLDPSTWWAEV